MLVSATLSPSVGPFTQRFDAPSMIDGWGSLMVVNASSQPLQVWLGEQLSTPAYTVPSAYALTVPAGGVNTICVAYPVGAGSGQTTILLTDAVLAAAGGIVPLSTAVPFVGINGGAVPTTTHIELFPSQTQAPGEVAYVFNTPFTGLTTYCAEITLEFGPPAAGDLSVQKEGAQVLVSNLTGGSITFDLLCIGY